MTSTYSIWLVPDVDSDAYRTLDALIGDFAESYADAPDFEPHVTVLGGVEAEQATVEDRTRDLLADRGPFDLAVGDVSCATTTHQCVFLLIDPSLTVMRLYRRATELFGSAESMYVPHLSLVYSDMPLEERRDLVGAVDVDALPDRIRVETVAVVDTDGAVPEWERVASVSL